MDLGMKGAAVCVSGGSKGMGRTTAVAFAREGARVVITGRDQGSIDATVAEMIQAGAPDAFGMACNLPDPIEIKAVFHAIQQRWGELNTLINMAGPTDNAHYGTDFATTSDESWDYYFQMGIMSVVRCSRLALPLMRKAGWGRIVNISSQSARIADPEQSAYMAIKAGLNALSKNMAWGLGKENIVVNSLTPGAIRTDLVRHWMELTRAVERGADPDDLYSVGDWVADYVGKRSRGVIGRAADPEEITPHIVLLGSKLNTFCIGSNVAVDGGSDYSTG